MESSYNKSRLIVFFWRLCDLLISSRLVLCVISSWSVIRLNLIGYLCSR